MTARVFISGSVKNWSDGTAWTPNGTPTAADDLTFPAASTGTLTIDGTSGAPNLCRSVDFTGFGGTLTHASAKQLNVGDGTAGAFKLVAGMTYAPNAGSSLKFVSTTTGNNITTAGKTMGPIAFDGVGGAWQLQDNFVGVNSAANYTVTLTNGSFDINGKTCTNFSLSSSNSNTRSLTLGAASITLHASALTPIWDIGTSSGITLSAASSTITFSTTTISQAFNGGGLTYGTVTSTTPTTATITISGSNSYTNLTLTLANATKSTTSGYAITAGTTQTVSSAFTANGNTTTLRNFIYSTIPGTAVTISANTATSTHTDFRDIAATGAASWNFSALTTTANGDCGGNSGISFTAPKNCFAKTATSQAWTASIWFTSSGGSTPIVPAVPLPHDLAFFDANSITAGSVTINLSFPRIPSTDWTNVANSPAFVIQAIFEVYGSLILTSSMSHTGGFAASFCGRSSYFLDGGTLTWPSSSVITLSAPTGTLSLARNFSSSSGVTISVGTWDENGFTSSVGAINVNGGVWSGSGAVTGTACTVAGGTFTLGGILTLTNAIAISSGTLNMNGYQITGHTTATISSTGILNLSGQLNGSGAISVTGGTIIDSGAAGELKGTTASFSGGTSTIRKMTLSSTFAISSTANLTLNPGTFTYVTSWTETGTTKTFAINGTLSETGGVKTVTAAGGSFTFG